jgi:hypothetical protein
MMSALSSPQQDQPASTPDKTTPELRSWSTPHVQSLNGAGRDTQAGSVTSDMGDGFPKAS